MIVYNIHTGHSYQCQPHPIREGEFLVPSDTTSEPPPAFDGSTQVCVFENNSWVVSNIIVDEVDESLPKIEIPTAMESLRYERNRLLSITDWRMLLDYTGTDQAEWIEYRKQLKDIPQRIESGELPEPTLNSDNELVFEHWPVEPA